MSEAVHQYRVFGLDIESEHPLPELQPATAAGDCLRIETESLERFAPMSERVDEGLGLRRCQGGIELWIPRVGGLAVQRDRIGVALQNAEWAQMRPYLLGSGLAAALYLRGRFPHHLSAVSAGGSVIAFTGASGAGKSTMAGQWLRQFDGALLSDDIAPLRADGVSVGIDPGLARLKLWSDALDQFGQDPAVLAQELSGRDKFYLPQSAAPQQPHRLSALVVLEDAGDQSAVGIERLRGLDALAQWRASLYRPSMAALLVDEKAIAEHLMALLELVPIYSLHRPRDLQQLSESVAQLQQRLRSDGCLL